MRCEDASIQASTHEPEDMRCKDARTEANTYQPEDTRLSGWKDTSKHT